MLSLLMFLSTLPSFIIFIITVIFVFTTVTVSVVLYERFLYPHYPYDPSGKLNTVYGKSPIPQQIPAPSPTWLKEFCECGHIREYHTSSNPSDIGKRKEYEAQCSYGCGCSCKGFKPASREKLIELEEQKADLALQTADLGFYKSLTR